MSECADTISLPAWKETERLAALRSFEILDTDSEVDLDNITRIAARVCNAPIAAISFIDSNRQWLKSAIGVSTRELPLRLSVCVHAIRQTGLFVIPDLSQDHRFNHRPYVEGPPHLRFYAGALLETSDGLPLGTLCVLDYEPRPDGLTEQQSEALMGLARAVMSHLQLKRANKALLAGERRAGTVAGAIAQTVWPARPVPPRDENGGIGLWLGTSTGIDARGLSEEASKASEGRLRLALSTAQMVAWELDLETYFTRRSENSTGLLGISSGPHQDFVRGVHPDDRPALEDALWGNRESGAGTVECRYTLPCGRMRWLGVRAERAAPNLVVGVTFDITDRKEAEEELWRSANHDALTGLPNRILFQRQLEEALDAAGRTETNVSILLIDLDDFKDVNDTLGHGAGDALLKEAALRLSAMFGERGMVARLGGDEFAVLIAEPLRLKSVPRLAENVIEALRRPFDFCGRTLVSRASVGIATFPDHDTVPAELMKDADIALYHAKARGRNRVVSYSPTMRRSTERRVSLIRDMRRAISNDEVAPFYQARVCLLTGRIIGFEALARWRHPEKGLLTPSTFGMAFDDGELATSIGKLMASKIASDMRNWLDKGLDFGRVALNLAPADFSQPRLAERILKVFEGFKIPMEHFEIEVPETVLIGRSSDQVSSVLEQLRRNGVQIALDDFGTGYASLIHLKQFPVDHVKIDRSFVRDVEEDADDAAIITAIIGLGKSLDLHITAEGVETLGQAQRLRELGCGNAQGYLYAKPVPGPQIPNLMANWSSRLVPSSQDPEKAA